MRSWNNKAHGMHRTKYENRATSGVGSSILNPVRWKRSWSGSVPLSPRQPRSLRASGTTAWKDADEAVGEEEAGSTASCSLVLAGLAALGPSLWARVSCQSFLTFSIRKENERGWLDRNPSSISMQDEGRCVDFLLSTPVTSTVITFSQTQV